MDTSLIYQTTLVSSSGTLLRWVLPWETCHGFGYSPKQDSFNTVAADNMTTNTSPGPYQLKTDEETVAMGKISTMNVSHDGASRNSSCPCLLVLSPIPLEGELGISYIFAIPFNQC